MKMKTTVLFILALLGMQTTFAQSVQVPLGDDTYHILDRMEIRNGKFADFFTKFRPVHRQDIVAFADSMMQDSSQLSKRDIADLNYIFRDNNDGLIAVQPLLGRGKSVKASETNEVYENPQENSPYYHRSKKPILKYFYRTPANFLEVNSKYFSCRINPILHLKAGMEKIGDSSRMNILNRRGIEIRGSIDNRVYFYSNIVEQQASFPNYVNEKIVREQAVPGAGFFKNYDSRFTKGLNDGFDYLLAQGHIGFRLTPHIGMQFGHGSNFIGDGYRSLLLSDFSTNYLYLKLNTQVWKFHYQNIFAELVGDYQRGADRLLPKKYMAAHYLDFNITKNLSVGVFESIIFDRNKSWFEWHYLNPIIFYRTVEQMLGSPDNALLGFSGKWNFAKSVSLYGQLVLDEFVFDELIVKRRGWWANKYGFQGGLKYINVAGIDHLDMQLEYNTVRPYTYTHNTQEANYTHYNQSLAHPLGANFKEAIAIFRYQPIQPLVLTAKLNYTSMGLDTLGSDWGGNIFTPNTEIEQIYGNKTGQGVNAKLMMAQFKASYQIRHRIYIDFETYYRRLNAVIDALDNKTFYMGLGIRMNISERQYDF